MVLIRLADITDADAVIDFNRRMAWETENRRLDDDALSRGVRAALTDQGRIRYFLAEDQGIIVGQAGITREWSDWRNGWFWWLQSVYVVPQRRRLGVLRALFQAIADKARRETDVIGLRLYMDRRNDVARRAYQALGMIESDYALLELHPL